MHVTWSSIELLHNVVVTFTHLNEIEKRPFPCVRYRAKVKLHGKNAAVQINTDGLVTQSRTSILTINSDLNGFTKWVHSHQSLFSKLPTGLVVFGEWAGPGVEKGMAVTQSPDKIFAVFGVQVGRDEDARIVYEPDQIKELLAPVLECPGLHVLPWEDTAEIVIDYGDKQQMESMSHILNDLVDRVEKEDPWVKRTFGISGIGEGLVFYPEPDSSSLSPADLALLMFKAKGEKHRTAGTKVAVQIAPSVVKGAQEFVDLMVTDARLEQGVSQLFDGQYDIRNTGTFIPWVVADVQKESTAELAASGLEWKQVVTAIQTRAREWYKERCTQLTK